MFDKLIINGEQFTIFFDKKHMKFYIRSIYGKDIKKYIKRNRFIKISKYLLYVDDKGYYNELNYIYNVLYYIGFPWNNFELEGLKQIRFESKQISELFYLKNKKRKELSYVFNKNNSIFKLNITASNKLENTKYGELNSESNMTIDLIKCDDYNTLNKIIKSGLNLLAILAVDINIKNCNIYIRDLENHIGNIVFSKFIQKEKYNDINFSMGNLWFLDKYISNIVDTIYNTPDINLYFLSCYQLEYDNYDFFNIYSCYEYEYSKIDKQKIYTLKEVEQIKTEKNKTLTMIEHEKSLDNIKKYISNYNPLEGHKQKLKNGLSYIRNIMYENYSDEEFYDFINNIYTLRINIVHNPSGNFIVDDTNMVCSFSQAIYIMFLKRCGISNKVIEKAIKDFFIPVA